MKLVYLDTSNLILLSKVAKKERDQFESFMHEWRDRHFVLALSQINLVELLRATRSDTRQEHFDLLQYFLPFRFESENFFEREIIRVLLEKGWLKIGVRDTETLTGFFAKEILDSTDLGTIYNAANIISRIGVYKAYGKANGLAWNAKASGSYHNSPKPRLRNMDSTLIGKIVTGVFAWFIGIDSKDSRLRNKTLDDLLEDFRFRVQAKSALRSKFKDEVAVVLGPLVSKIAIHDCKGLWLRNEVEKNLLKAADYDPNNEYDLDSIQYLPYVDISTADKRIVDKTIQVLRRPTVLDSLRNTSPPRKSANSLEAFGQSLFSEN